MAKEWQTFVRKFADLSEGEAELFIKDLTPGPEKYDTRHVRATLSRTPEKLNRSDILWVRGESGLKYPRPWFIQIHEELPPWVAGAPWENVLSAIENIKKSNS